MPATEDEQYLPKEPLDFPREHEALPADPKEIPAHATHGQLMGSHQESYDEHDNWDRGGKDHYSQVKTVLAWHAPGRPYRKKSREFYFNALLIALALEVIIFLFHEYTLMAVVASLLFLTYAISFVPPHDFYYKITSEGVMVEDHFALWQELYDFYFKRIEGQDVLIIRTESYYPGELLLTLGDLHKEQVKTAMLPYLPYREFVKPTFMEKSGDWLSRTFPLERQTDR